MAFTINEKTVGMWVVDFREGGEVVGDWTGVVQEEDDGTFSVVFRTRAYDRDDPDNDPWSGKDKKTWYRAKPKSDVREEVIEQMEAMASVMASQFCGEHDSILMENGDVEAFARELESRPWAHTKTLTKEEYEAEYGEEDE